MGSGALSWRLRDFKKHRVNSLPHLFSPQNVCRRCYRGNLVSIHSISLINRIRCLTRSLNRARVWIGATYKGVSEGPTPTCRKSYLIASREHLLALSLIPAAEVTLEWEAVMELSWFVLAQENQ